jgi:7-cyano-7-deazaguanine synthase
VPGRNLLFLTLAAILARRVDAQHLVGGMCQTDFAGYPDCRHDFIQATQQTLRLGFGFDFLIHTPLMFLDKAQTWLLADQLGCLEVVRDLSHTCYAGDRTTSNPWGFGCGQCDACHLRARGWEQAFGDA